MRVDDPQFMAPRTDARHRPRLGQRQLLAPLEPAQEISRFDSGLPGKGWRFDLSMEPDERLILRAHGVGVYVRTDIFSRTDTAT